MAERILALIRRCLCFSTSLKRSVTTAGEHSSHARLRSPMRPARSYIQRKEFAPELLLCKRVEIMVLVMIQYLFPMVLMRRLVNFLTRLSAELVTARVLFAN